jgi:phosphoribosylformimino-5-aminoimidazole carboxamide ribonucleotide (ProFAR) isomerase
VNSVQDIERLCNSTATIAGIVIGRALYDGRINPAQALMTARCQSQKS